MTKSDYADTLANLDLNFFEIQVFFVEARIYYESVYPKFV